MKTYLVRGFCFATALTLLASPSVGLAAGIAVTGSNAGKFNAPNPSGFFYFSTIQNNNAAGSSKFTWGMQSGFVDRNWMEYAPTGNPISTSTEEAFKTGDADVLQRNHDVRHEPHLHRPANRPQPDRPGSDQPDV